MSLKLDIINITNGLSLSKSERLATERELKDMVVKFQVKSLQKRIFKTGVR